MGHKVITPDALRQVLIDSLSHIAYPELARQYQRNVPIADIASELVCHWDDEYHSDDPVLPEAFSSTELSALADFDTVFDSVCESIEPWPQLDQLLENSAWQELSRKARDTLGVLGVSAQQGIRSDGRTSISSAD